MTHTHSVTVFARAFSRFMYICTGLHVHVVCSWLMFNSFRGSEREGVRDQTAIRWMPNSKFIRLLNCLRFVGNDSTSVRAHTKQSRKKPGGNQRRKKNEKSGKKMRGSPLTSFCSHWMIELCTRHEHTNIKYIDRIRKRSHRLSVHFHLILLFFVFINCILKKGHNVLTITKRAFRLHSFSASKIFTSWRKNIDSGTLETAAIIIYVGKLFG